jgi:hypothetical protein
MAARLTHIVWQLELAAVRAFLELGRRQRMVAAAHVPLGRRSFSLWDSHCGTFDINKNGDDLRLVSAGCPAAAAGSSRTAAPIANKGAEASF